MRRISKPKILRNGEEEETKTKGKPVEDNKKPEEHKGTTKLKFSIRGYKVNPRVHVYGLTFLPNQVMNDFLENERITRGNVSLDVFAFAQWKNAYLSNRQLGDEYRYVFERKFLERYLGNTLDRPQLVLKRNKIRETQFDQEVISQGNNYSSNAIESFSNLNAMQPMGLPKSSMSSNVAPMQMQQVARGAYSTSISSGPINLYSNLVNPNPPHPNYKSFMNFLDNSAFIGENMHPDADGNIEVEFDVSKYSSIVIMAVDNQTCSQAVIDVNDVSEIIEKRDLSLTDPLSEEKYYREVRNSENVKKDHKFRIEDITSTDYIIIDSLDKVRRVQDEIRKVHSKPLSGSDLFFLLKWNTFDEEEKHKKYNRYMCHEVNLFLYFKDREYFEKVVKPFIQNKMEKTFIDNYLLGNEEVCLEYSKIEHFTTLNSFEQCLMVEVAARKDKKLAQKLTDRITSYIASQIPNVDMKNKIFDTVLNLNMLQGGGKIDLDLLAQESDSEQSQHDPNNGKYLYIHIYTGSNNYH